MLTFRIKGPLEFMIRISRETRSLGLVFFPPDQMQVQNNSELDLTRM